MTISTWKNILMKYFRIFFHTKSLKSGADITVTTQVNLD